MPLILTENSLMEMQIDESAPDKWQPRANGETRQALSIIEGVLIEKGIDVEWFQLGKEPVRECIHCGGCKDRYRCVFDDDACDELIERIISADGLIIDSPVYFAGGPSAAVATCWRSGASATLDRLKICHIEVLNSLLRELTAVMSNRMKPTIQLSTLDGRLFTFMGLSIKQTESIYYLLERA